MLREKSIWRYYKAAEPYNVELGGANNKVIDEMIESVYIVDKMEYSLRLNSIIQNR
jgi:hypothetical protein